MKVVIIGDIGWRHLYHLGDEAMTEAAISALRERGITDVHLIAGEPIAAAEFYGLPAVPRVGFERAWPREQSEATLSAFTEALETGGDAPGEEIRSLVRTSDVVIIAGGGNMNANHVRHLYERTALARAARHYGKPLFVTSQTVGPHLRERDVELVKEILEYATCFGAREASTYELLLSFGARADRTFLCQDDAVLLEPQSHDDEYAQHLTSGEFAVGSFTVHTGTSGLSRDTYTTHLASTLDDVAQRHDLDIALVPHVGSLDRTVRTHDQLSNDIIAGKSRSGRVFSLEMPTARNAVALTRRARLSLSTRYHPTVFSPAVGTPAVSIATSYYSSARMTGSLAQFGLADFCVPTESWINGPFTKVVDTALGADVRHHLETAGPATRVRQNEWWDAIVAAMKGAGWASPSDDGRPVPMPLSARWLGEVRSVRRVSDELGRLQIASRMDKEDAAALIRRDRRIVAELDRARATVKRLERSLDAARNRKVVKMADAIARVSRPGRAQ